MKRKMILATIAILTIATAALVRLELPFAHAQQIDQMGAGMGGKMSMDQGMMKSDKTSGMMGRDKGGTMGMMRGGCSMMGMMARGEMPMYRAGRIASSRPNLPSLQTRPGFGMPL